MVDMRAEAVVGASYLRELLRLLGAALQSTGDAKHPHLHQQNLIPEVRVRLAEQIFLHVPAHWFAVTRRRDPLPLCSGADPSTHARLCRNVLESPPCRDPSVGCVLLDAGRQRSPRRDGSRCSHMLRLQ
jgi:hypothetical protein